MRFISLLYSLAPLAISALGFDVSDLPDGVYKVPIGDNGQIDYNSAEIINLTHPSRPYLSRARSDSGVRPRAIPIHFDDSDYDDSEEEEPDEDEEEAELGLGDSFNATSIGERFGRGKCHSHFPNHHNRFITGHTMLNLNNYPLALSLFMEWIETGPDSGWLDRGEVRMAKTEDLVVGACIFKRKKLRTCVHELSMALDAADHECAAGRVGCHACSMLKTSLHPPTHN
ncbi:hypothetical protein GGS21DRAFT_529748 [Xylaria nigripes]|nr:hypothetical protein GGS21DRAFT_529748 [Xylaria nigripes]